MSCFIDECEEVGELSVRILLERNGEAFTTYRPNQKVCEGHAFLYFKEYITEKALGGMELVFAAFGIPPESATTHIEGPGFKIERREKWK
jgi:hypothetical protein